MQPIDWNHYLQPEGIVEDHKRKSAATFAGQKERIRKLCYFLSPQTVVCMGAGYLNDIPVEDFIRINADIYFAEWMKDVTAEAFRYDLVTHMEQHFACLACRCSANPKKYCNSYKEWEATPSIFNHKKKQSDYCQNFKPAPTGAIPLCANYVAGDFPKFLHTDVTQGRASIFAENIQHFLAQAKKPRQAFHKAIQKSKQLDGKEHLPLANHSVDFITSSMVVSQFDFEPYTYFAQNVMRQFGKESIDKDIETLNNLETTLRDNLFLAQIEGHCQEILRLLKPNGRIYFSIETLHRETPENPWFQVDVAIKAMAIIGSYFYFDIETLPETMFPERIAMVNGGESIVYSHLLRPKEVVANV